MGVSVSEEPAGFRLLILPWRWRQYVLAERWCHLPNFTVSRELLSCARLLVSSKSPICCRFQAYELPIILLAIHSHLIFLLSTLPAQDFLLFFWEKKFRLKECFSSLFGSSSIASASLVFFPLLCQRRVHGWLATEGWLTERVGNQPAGVGKRWGLIGNQSGWVERGRTCRWLWTCSFLEPIHYKLVRGFYCTAEEQLKAIASNWN
jgi:hypothetical protein